MGEVCKLPTKEVREAQGLAEIVKALTDSLDDTSALVVVRYDKKGAPYTDYAATGKELAYGIALLQERLARYLRED